MPLVIPTDHALIVMNFRHPSTPREMSVTFGVAFDPLENINNEHVVNRVANAFTVSTLQARMDASITLSTISGTFGPTPDPVIYEKTFNLAGGTVFETPPLNTALLVRKNSALGGRANRGRFYWPGLLAEADVNEVGIINGASVLALQSDFDSFWDQLNNTSDPDEEQLNMVVLHDSTSPVQAPTLVTSLTVDSLAATQRRRMRS